MGDVQQPGRGAVLLGDGSQPTSSARSSWLVRGIYSACSGAIAMVAGAGASLMVAAADRIIAWCAVAGVASVGAGLIRHSGLVSACREAFSRWLGAASSS